MTYDLLVIFTQPPLSGLNAREGLDTALVSATFEQKTALLFLGEGLLQLLPNQQPDALELKGTQAMLKALPLYDIDAIFIEADALQRFDLEAANLLLPAQTLTAAAMQALLTSSKNTLVF